MIALVGLIGVVDVMTVSPPQLIVSPQTVDNAFMSPAQVAADAQGATIVWLEGATATRACVKAVRIDTNGKPQPAVELACAAMPSNVSPIGGPAIGGGGGKSLVAWTRDGELVGQLLTPSLASTPAFKVKLPDESPRAIGWDGTQYWILTASSVSATVINVSAVGKVGKPQKVAPVGGLDGPWLRCGVGECLVVTENAKFPIQNSALGPSVALEDWRKSWEVLVPTLRDRDLVPGRAIWVLRGVESAETTAGTFVASEASTSWEGDQIDLQLVGSQGQRHRPTSLVHETLADVGALDDTHFVVVTRAKTGTLARIATVDPKKLPAVPAMPATTKLRITVDPPKVVDVSVDIAPKDSPERIWTKDVKTDAKGVAELEPPVGTAWVNAWEGGMFGAAKFEMIDLAAGKTTNVKLKLVGRESIYLPESFQSFTIRVPDVLGLHTDVGNNLIYTDPIAAGRHWLIVDADMWRMRLLVDVPKKGGKDHTKLTFVATLEPGDPGIKLAMDGSATVISSVAPGSSGEKQKLAVGDTLLAIDGKPVVDYVDASTRVFGPPGKPVKLKVRSAKANKERTITLPRAK